MNRFVRAAIILGAGIGLAFANTGGAMGDPPGDADPEVVKAVQASPRFQQVVSDNPDLALAPGMVRTERVDNLAVAIHMLHGDATDTTLVVSHFIDLATGEIRADKQFRLTVLPDTEAAMATHFPGEEPDSADVTKVARVHASHDGTPDFSGTVTDTGLLRGDQGYEQLAETAVAVQGCPHCGGDPAARSELTTLLGAGGTTAQAPGWCENVMNALCGASGAAQCFFVCAGFGTTPVGLGCGVLCGLIASIGCANTVELVCG